MSSCIVKKKRYLSRKAQVAISKIKLGKSWRHVV